MALGAETLLETLEGLEKGSITPEKQGDSPNDYAKMLTKEMGLIDFTRTAAELDCFVRGMNPWPSAYTTLDGKTLKIWRAKPVAENGKAGSVLRVGKDSFVVGCGENALEILEVQLEGKKRMPAGDFLKGTHIEAGKELGGEFGGK